MARVPDLDGHTHSEDIPSSPVIASALVHTNFLIPVLRRPSIRAILSVVAISATFETRSGSWHRGGRTSDLQYDMKIFLGRRSVIDVGAEFSSSVPLCHG